MSEKQGDDEGVRILQSCLACAESRPAQVVPQECDEHRYGIGLQGGALLHSVPHFQGSNSRRVGQSRCRSHNFAIGSLCARCPPAHLRLVLQRSDPSSNISLTLDLDVHDVAKHARASARAVAPSWLRIRIRIRFRLRIPKHACVKLYRSSSVKQQRRPKIQGKECVREMFPIDSTIGK